MKTNVAQRFLKLLDKHFPRSSKLHKIFNRNSVKVSYSCMPNVKSVIPNHNRRILKSNKTSPDLKTCNCRVKSACPLLGKCLTKSLVYNAEITTTDTHESMNYIGITQLVHSRTDSTTVRNPSTTLPTPMRQNIQNTLGTLNDKTDNSTSDGQL